VVLATYRVVPPRAPSWRSAAPPAVIAALGIYGLGQVFLFAAPRVLGVAALAGPLATVFIALAWLSFTFQGLLLGAAWVRVRDDAESATDGSALARPAAATEPGVGGE